MKKKIRIFSLVISVALIFGCMTPLSVFSANESSEEIFSGVEDASEEIFSGIEDADKIEELKAGLDTTGPGIVLPSELASLEGVKSVLKAEDMSSGSSFKYTKNATGMFKCDNGYLSVGPVGTLTDEGAVETKVNIQFWDYFEGIDSLDNYTSDAFVYSFDLRLGETYSNTLEYDLQLLEFYYIVNADTKTYYKPAISYLALSKDGTILYRNGQIANSPTQNTGYSLVPGDSEFTTISMYFEPSKGTYSLYADGYIIAKDIPLFSESDVSALNYTDGKIIPGYFRILNNTIAVEENFMYFDNIKFYYADTFAECAKHAYDYKGHSHKEDGSTTVTFACPCGKTEQLTLTGEDDPVNVIETLKATLKTQGNGITEPSALESLEGIGSILKKEDMSSESGFKSTSNAKGMFKYENGYLSVGPVGTLTDEGAVETTVNIQFSDWFDGIDSLDNYTSDAFVYSFDLMLGETYSDTLTSNLQLLEFYYIVNADTKTYYKPAISYLALSKDGTILYRNGQIANSPTQNTGYSLVPGDSEFTTISMYFEPSKGTYSLYADGYIIAKDIPLFSESDVSALNYTDGKIIPGYFRILNNTIAVEENFMYFDNIKFYYANTFLECTEHEFEHIGNTEAGDKAIFACHCRYTEEVAFPTIEVENEGRCELCGGNYLTNDGKAVVTKRNVVLNEMLSLKLYAKVASDIAETAKMVIEVDGKTEEFVISEMTPTGGEYVFEIKLSSIDISKNVEMYIEVGGVKSENTYTTSIRDYLETLMNTSNDASEKALCIATLNYGAYAQEYFAQKKSDTTINADLANKNLTDAEKSVASATEEILAANTVSISGNATDTGFVGATLVCDSKISMKVFFTSESFASVSGADTDATASDDMYFVEIKDLLPTELDKSYTITVTNAEGQTKSVTLSVISALNALLSSEAAEEFKDLGRAIYLYNKAADAYVA